MDLLSGLWEEALFARLPVDAPAELKELVDDIEDPRRVYAVHRASRRHDFQQLLQKFIVQIRDGCGASHCTTSTCFTCRKRIAGKAPIRRYNGTSARTLAAYLASQDHAESGLCPTLRSPKSTPVALDSLVFTFPRGQNETGKHDIRYPATTNTTTTTNSGVLQPVSPKRRRGSVAVMSYQARSRSSSMTESANATQSPAREHGSPPPGSDPRRRPASELGSVRISEKSVSKDYRSFGANLFETTAFKMVEWLLPQAVQKMVGQAGSIPEEITANGSMHMLEDAEQPDATESGSSHGARSQASSSHDTAPESLRTTPPPSFETDSIKPSFQPIPDRDTADLIKPFSPADSKPSSRSQPGVDRGPKERQSARPQSATQVTRRVSRETLQPEPLAGDLDTKPAKISSQTLAKGVNQSYSARPVPQLPKPGVFDQATANAFPPLPNGAKRRAKPGKIQVDGSADERHNADASPKDPVSDSLDSSTRPTAMPRKPVERNADYHPQALRRLDTDLINFVCDILQDDGTLERHLLSPPAVTSAHGLSAATKRSFKRVAASRRDHSSIHLRLEWRLFIEQSMFFVLSDSTHLIDAFTKQGQLYDSQTLWHCMLRMTRVAPTLVFHSLWLAAACLFAPPKSLQALRSPTGRPILKQEQSLSNVEAGYLLSICLHALIAAAPLVRDAQQLHDMSRLRSHGLALSGSGAISRQPPELCLQYEDAFGNDLAMRLARRLFLAITTRRYFDDINALHGRSRKKRDQGSVLAPLFSQLDSLNMEGGYILEFTVHERTLHETRMPTLLLDWARQVMLHDWDGKPEIPGDTPFGGALALIDAVHRRLQALPLGDAEFRCDYFADRLSSVSMPVFWLSHTSTRQKQHLLDFPYIFKPSMLVSYFRAINFSRMSRGYEESSSVRSRMPENRSLSFVSMPISPSRVVENPAYVSIAQEMLRTASTRYLILNIRRDEVIQDVFDQLWRREERELTRPIKVHLGEDDGEEGFDSGGVQQEFFRLALAEALNPDFGAFTVDDRTRMVWFNPASVEPDWKFELIGLLVSLAVYNGLTLPITFPKALYRKLLGEPVTELHHIADGWPDLASGLTTLLEWDEKDGAVEDVFARTYEFSVSVFDQPISRMMQSQQEAQTGEGSSQTSDWPQLPKTFSHTIDAGTLAADNPSDAPLVTRANRNAYVTDYIRYLATVSVAPQYDAFARGFRACLHPKSLQLLSPNLLQSLVEGVQDIDIPELQRTARYVGWDSSHRTVRHFWDVVRRYDDTMKRRLLEFVTASDRVPVGGVKNMQFVVQRNGEEEGEHGHLPTAYTCYGTLLLPEYKSKDVLRERLSMALENAQGFGFA